MTSINSPATSEAVVARYKKALELTNELHLVLDEINTLVLGSESGEHAKLTPVQEVQGGVALVVAQLLREESSWKKLDDARHRNR